MKIDENLILQFLAEDGFDVTTRSIVDSSCVSCVSLICKETDGMVLCGIEIVKQVLFICDPCCDIMFCLSDGDFVQNGQIILKAKGLAVSILKAERVALNILQHLCGISTKTRKFALLASPLKLLDTRKTLPLYRQMQKYAVKIGGGFNHRASLSDLILIKDNHIAIAGGVKNAILLARKNAPHYLKIEVECENISQVLDAISCDVDIIMLDNFLPNNVKDAVLKIKSALPSCIVEVSGGVNEGNLSEYSSCGADFISCGALTHSVKSCDISAEII